MNTFKCPDCQSTFKKQSKLNRHINETHKNLKNYECQICQKKFKRNQHLQTHLIIHNPDSAIFICPHDSCNMRFKLNHHLQTHIKLIHLKDYKYICQICDEKFSKKINLHRHQTQKHEMEKPYECDQCDKRYIKFGLLQSHKIKKHQPIFKIKKFSTELIDNNEIKSEFKIKKFSTELIDNNEIKSDVFTPLCVPCTPQNQQEKTIKSDIPQFQQQKTDKKFIQCSIEGCQKMYTSYYNLKTHIKTYHLKIRDFICKFKNCDAKFLHNKSLKQHQQKEHHFLSIDDKSQNESISYNSQNSDTQQFE